MIQRAARRRARQRRKPRPEILRSIVIPKHGQPRLNGQPVPWFTSWNGLQIKMPGEFMVGYVTLELPFVMDEISIFEYDGREPGDRLFPRPVRGR